MEFFYMQLLTQSLVTCLQRMLHSGEYDKSHSPESFLITEDEWSNASSQPSPQTK